MYVCMYVCMCECVNVWLCECVNAGVVLNWCDVCTQSRLFCCCLARLWSDMLHVRKLDQQWLPELCRSISVLLRKDTWMFDEWAHFRLVQHEQFLLWYVRHRRRFIVFAAVVSGSFASCRRISLFVPSMFSVYVDCDPSCFSCFDSSAQGCVSCYDASFPYPYLDESAHTCLAAAPPSHWCNESKVCFGMQSKVQCDVV